MDSLTNRFKAAIGAGRQQIGLWCSLASPISTEIVAGAGFDWLLLDMEHSANDLRDIYAQLQAMMEGATHPMVRVPSDDPITIKRILDAGAQSLMIPNIDDAEQASRVVAATRYAPRGVRGFSQAPRAARFGRIPDYHTRCEAEIFVAVQVESRRALDNLDAIAAVEGVDGVFIGPGDLSTSLGHLGQQGHPEVVRTIEEAVAPDRQGRQACRHPDPERGAGPPLHRGRHPLHRGGLGYGPARPQRRGAGRALPGLKRGRKGGRDAGRDRSPDPAPACSGDLPRTIRLSASDNVAIVVNAFGLPAGTVFPDGLELVEFVPQGHKVALETSRRADRCAATARWWASPRRRSPGAPGWRYRGSRRRSPPPSTPWSWPPACRPPCPRWRATPSGYRNPDGSVGTKNILAISISVQCVAGTLDVAIRRIKQELLPRYPNVDDVVGLTHAYGCGVAINAPRGGGADPDAPEPRVEPEFRRRVMVVGLGCEKLVSERRFSDNGAAWLTAWSACRTSATRASRR